MRRCLVIDPSTMVRRVAARIIREFGFEVMEARSAQEGLDLCRAAMPAVVMLDWKAQSQIQDKARDQSQDEDKASHPDGADFIAELRQLAGERGAPVPAILFCTAERSVEGIVAALRAGADEYIMKPFDSDVIESKFALAGLIDPIGSGRAERPSCAMR